MTSRKLFSKRISSGKVTAAAALAMVASAVVCGQASADVVVPAEFRTTAAQVQQVAQLGKASPVPVAPASYSSNNLDGWIRSALGIMSQHGIPGSYDGIYRNAMRESSGNPNAINLTDSNAAAGIPSKGLMQVIDPTFQAYHVDGTSWDIYDPIANIAAACNYAASRYGSIDNVDSAY